ncbi:MAG: NosD domain-containing protein [Candidatus Thorarchaeota archaeon]
MSETVMRKNKLRVLACSLCVILSLTGLGLFLAPMGSYDLHVAAYPLIDEFSQPAYWPDDTGDAMLGATLDNVEIQASSAKLQQFQPIELDEIQSEFTLISARPRLENWHQDPIINAPDVEIQRPAVTMPEYDYQPPMPSLNGMSQRAVDMLLPIPLQDTPLGVPHDPIFIQGDDDFDRQAKREDWLGEGTMEDPYLIEGLDIDVGGDDRSCIEIHNIDKIFFRIRFCTLQGATPDWRAGIHLYNVNYGRFVNSTWVSNNTCIGNCYGIRIDDAYSIVVANNTCSGNNWEGIGVLYESRQNMVRNNRCYDNGWSGIGVGIGAYNNMIRHNFCFNNPQAGINLWLGIDNVLTDNDCSGNNLWGIAIRGESTGNQIQENLCRANANGVFVSDSDDNTLIGNTCTDNDYGICLEESNINMLDGNTCSDNFLEGIAVLYSSTLNIVKDNECFDNGWSGIGVGIGAFDNRIIHNHCFINPQAGINLWLGIDNVLTDNNCSENALCGIAVRGESTGNQILENLCKANANGIFVSDSDDNTLIGNTCTDNDYGIYLEESNGNSLIGNTCSYNENGIYLFYSESNTLDGNTCDANIMRGIRLYSSNENTLSGNTCNENVNLVEEDGEGIILSYSDENILSGNTCSDNINGICLHQSHGNTLDGNTCNANNMIGIDLVSSNDNTLSGNTCSDNTYGIRPHLSHGNTLDGNTCSDNDEDGIYIFYRSDGNTLSGNICTGNSDYGIYLEESDGNTLSGNICTGNSDYGIYLEESDGNMLSGNTCDGYPNAILLLLSNENTLDGNSCSSFLHAIYLDESHGNTLSGNTCNNNKFGIYLCYSDWNTLSGNTCNVNDYGIYLWDSHHNTLSGNTCNVNENHGIVINYSHINTLDGNTCLHNWEDGVVLYYSTGNTLEGNTCTYNEDNGIRLDRADSNILDGNTCDDNVRGIKLENSNGNRVQENTCNGNADAGISIRYSDDNRVYYDICIGNKFGLFITSSDYIVVWWNTFAESSEHDVQENVVGTLNDFYYNYYSEYVGPDNDGDGIGDTPYNIPGEAGSVDPHPLVYYSKSRWLAPLNDFTLEFGQRLALLNLDLDLEAGSHDPPVESWWINDTEHFAINHEGRITDLMQLPVGTYRVEVGVENIYSVFVDEWLAPYGIYVGILTAIFTITVVDSLSVQWSLELNGNFDYPDTEEVPIQIGALLTFDETGEPISGAYIELRIYDPDGNLFWTVIMSEIEPGVYLYRSPETIAYYVAEGIWQKGIYLVVGEASSGEGNPVRARSLIQYHIDPPSASGSDTLVLFILAGFGAVILLYSVFAGQYIWRKRRFNHRPFERIAPIQHSRSMERIISISEDQSSAS